MTRIVVMAVLLATVLVAAPTGAPRDTQLSRPMIAFVRSPPSGSGYQVFVMDGDGRHQRRAARRDIASAPAWSPSGDRLVYTSTRGQIFIVELARRRERGLRHASCHGPVWAPDEERLACDSTEPHRVVVVRADGRGSRVATPDCCIEPAWSPGGQWIAYYNLLGDTFDPSAGASGI